LVQKFNPGASCIYPRLPPGQAVRLCRHRIAFLIGYLVSEKATLHMGGPDLLRAFRSGDGKRQQRSVLRRYQTGNAVFSSPGGHCSPASGCWILFARAAEWGE